MLNHQINNEKSSLKIHRKIQKLRMISHHLYKRFKLFQATNQLLHFFFVKKVEYYQPLYNFALPRNQKPQRACYDRADTILQELKAFGNGGRILDIGCSLGYFSNYFSDRGYFIDGIDSSADNIKISQIVSQINNKNLKFTHATFTEQFINDINITQYDVAFVFSVFHHIIHSQGLEYTQNLVAKLLKKIPILFVELAIKNEHTDAAWRTSLPEDELEIFKNCSDITIKRLGYFSNHLSNERRPLYMITKDKMEFGETSYTIEDRKFTAYEGGKYYGRQYYVCKDVFIKQYHLTKDLNNSYNLKQLVNEIKMYQLLSQNPFFPKLINHQQNPHLVEVVLSKLPGKNLHNLLSNGEKISSPLKIFHQVIQALDVLKTCGIYHNDLRLWNIMLDGERVYLFDLALADEEEKENTNLALSWLLSQLYQFRYHDFSSPITQPPEITLNQLPEECRNIFSQLQTTTSFHDFLIWYKNEVM